MQIKNVFCATSVVRSILITFLIFAIELPIFFSTVYRKSAHRKRYVNLHDKSTVIYTNFITSLERNYRLAQLFDHMYSTSLYSHYLLRKRFIERNYLRKKKLKSLRDLREKKKTKS